MTTNKTQVTVLRGKAFFAKILGDPVPNYNKDGKEWKMDLKLANKESLKELKDLGVGDRVKQKENYLNGSPYITLKQSEFRKDGITRNDPIKVYDAAGKEWDQSRLIGNESDVDVKIAVMDFGPGKKKGMYIRGVRVLNLVPYERKDFPPLSEEDEFFANAAAAFEQNDKELANFKKDFGLDDDVNDIGDDDEDPV